MRLTELSIRRPLLVTVVFTGLILFGIISYQRLNYNLLPKFDANTLTIITVYPGASAREVETSVTKVLEEALSSMEGLDRINANSQQNVSVIILELKNHVDVNNALADAQRKVDQVMSQLPDEVQKPSISKFSTDDVPVLRIALSAELSNRELYEIVDKTIRPVLANVPGVGAVQVLGATPRQFRVNLKKDRLEALGLTPVMVSQALQASGLSVPAGTLEDRFNDLTLTFDSKFTSAEELQDLLVYMTPSGGTVYLKDVAEVADDEEEPSTLSRINGRPSIGLTIMKQTDANSVEVSALVKARLAELEKQWAQKKLKFDIASDQSTYTLASANAVVEDLALAILIVALVMLFFLHSVRSSLFVLVALPTSMIPTFILMYALNMSLNLMTLMALSLVVGILVDDAIVILENIYRHMEMGKDRRRAALDGRAEIGFTAIAITLVDVVVFVPLSLAGGIIGNILREFSLVVVASTLMSLLVCFTLTPLLASRFGKLTHLTGSSLWIRLNRAFENLIASARDAYARILRWSLAHKRYVLGGTLLAMAGSFLLPALGFIGATFVKQGDRSQFNLRIEMPPGTSLMETNRIVLQAERILFSHPEVISVFTNVGYSSTGFTGLTSSNPHFSESTVNLVPPGQRSLSSTDFAVLVEKEISTIPGVMATVAPITVTGNTGEADVSISVKSPNRDSLRVAAEKIMEILKKTPGTKYHQFSTKIPRPEIRIVLNKEKMTRLGLNAAQVGLTLATAVRGNEDLKVTVEGEEHTLLVQNDAAFRRSPEDLKSLSFPTATGQNVYLDQFAVLKETLGESVLERTDRLPSVRVNANVVGRSPGTVGREVAQAIGRLRLPSNVTWQFVGNQQRMQESFSSLGFSLIIAILLVYLVMVALYESLLYPFVVLFALPLASIGAFLALALTMEDLSIFSIIGIIMLMGLVAKNGILLVDFTNQLKEEGMALTEALIEAGRERFRPILMTTLAMVFGMLPIALNKSAGAEVKNGMAWVIIGGLTSSLALTLVVVPCIYYIFEKLKLRWAARSASRLPASAAEGVL
ncbi:MAG: efflux RND transporter permease subunit [Flavobacteriales bacterium]|nr:efflux RND transporter permease subunit [Flavobacteriales bacterium]MDW8431389.1 efflux RND transporter permease subunit [Flavobacteriales bacterium]